MTDGEPGAPPDGKPPAGEPPDGKPPIGTVIGLPPDGANGTAADPAGAFPPKVPKAPPEGAKLT